MSACRATLPFSLPRELLQEIARVGRKDVGVSGESVSMSVSWNAGVTELNPALRELFTTPRYGYATVSYTHLTLPTILRV